MADNNEFLAAIEAEKKKDENFQSEFLNWSKVEAPFYVSGVFVEIKETMFEGNTFKNAIGNFFDQNGKSFKSLKGPQSLITQLNKFGPGKVLIKYLGKKSGNGNYSKEFHSFVVKELK